MNKKFIIKNFFLNLSEKIKKILLICNKMYYFSYWKTFILNRNTLDYDIALLRVSEEINFNKFVQPICMTSLKSLMTNCFAVGWGQLSKYFI